MPLEYTVKSQKVLDTAKKISRSYKHGYTGSEHLLLAFLEEGGSVVSEVLKKNEVAAGTVRELIKEQIAPESGVLLKERDGYTPKLVDILKLSEEVAISMDEDKVSTEHILIAIIRDGDNLAVRILNTVGVNIQKLYVDILIAIGEDINKYKEQIQNSRPGQNRMPAGQLLIEKYSRDLTELAAAGKLDPVIGRETEIQRIIQTLSRRTKNNPCLVGEPGVGKTAITYGLAQRINDGEVPDPLKGSRIFALDLSALIAGTQFRGEFEKRFKKVLSEIGKEEKPIVYIDEIHNLTGAGAVGEGGHDAANLLKPYLTNGHIRFIGATTYDEYKKRFEKNKSLTRRFANVEIKEPSEEEAVKILEGLKFKYEDFHQVIYVKDVLNYIVTMSAKHINERFLPDKAIDLMDEAGAYRKLHPKEGAAPLVDKKVVAEVLNKICRVPLETVENEDAAGLAVLDEKLKGRIFGQDEAIDQVVNAIKFSRAGLLEDNKPLANLLFVGPTGVGKTEVAKSLSEELGIKLIRFDMSEYGEKHAVAKLIGAPAGYVGYEEGGLLTEEIRKNPSAVLLLDEVEKAHPDIFSVLLQVMDYATLTDNQGRKADFRNVVLIMTSNAGANKIGKKSIGFDSGYQDDSILMEEVKKTFQPEFRNRLNKIVVFNGMDDDMAERIVGKKLKELEDMLAKKKITLSVDDAARSLILERGISLEFGAREIDRIIRNDIKPLFVDDILFGSLKDGGSIRLNVVDGEFCVDV